LGSDAPEATARAEPVVAITGASSGVGRATAIAFARLGWHVALIARGADGLTATLADVERAGGSGLVLQADVSDEKSVHDAADSIVARWGRIDVWVNNAMLTVFSDVARLEPRELRRVTEVTYHGAVWGTMAALRHMRQRGGGVIVQVGSALAYRSIPLQSAYCAAKSALRGFTDSLRCELIHERSGVHVTTVHLPAVNTPQFDVARSHMGARPRPLGTIYQPELAARAIVWAAHHRRRELWVGASTEQAIFGTRIAPGLLDWFLGKLAVRAQRSALPPPPADNLFAALPGDRGARGRFDGQAKERSAHLWLATHPLVLYGGAVAALIGVTALWRK
jgi:NAD(P)-dependent dehydrogenase (short-subunit alcohol dehydrogenase family)